MHIFSIKIQNKLYPVLLFCQYSCSQRHFSVGRSLLQLYEYDEVASEYYRDGYEEPHEQSRSKVNIQHGEVRELPVAFQSTA